MRFAGSVYLRSHPYFCELRQARAQWYLHRVMAFTRRHLPHWHPDARLIFVTWHLHGSISPAALIRLSEGPALTGRQRFVALENLLHSAAWGPRWLENPEIARSVKDCLLEGDQTLGRYRLVSYVLMSNHVHVLILLILPLAKIMKGLKGVSARNANLALRRTGQPFWEAESFDHWCRTEAECIRVRDYIENNPVRAGLVAKAEDWKWSSAYDRRGAG